MTNANKKLIREKMMEREGKEHVRIMADGSVMATGTMQRGDGGPVRWTQYRGQASEILAEILN